MRIFLGDGYSIIWCVTQCFSCYLGVSNDVKTGTLGGISGLIMAWVNELTGYDNESVYWVGWCKWSYWNLLERALLVASCNTFAHVFQVWCISPTEVVALDWLQNSLGMAPNVSDGWQWANGLVMNVLSVTKCDLPTSGTATVSAEVWGILTLIGEWDNTGISTQKRDRSDIQSWDKHDKDGHSDDQICDNIRTPLCEIKTYTCHSHEHYDFPQKYKIPQAFTTIHNCYLIIKFLRASMSCFGG